MEKNAINVAQQLSLLDFLKKRGKKQILMSSGIIKIHLVDGLAKFSSSECVLKNSVNYVATKVDLCTFIRPQCNLLIFA